MDDLLKLIVQALDEAIIFTELFLIPIIKAWWWAPLPFLLFNPAVKSWLEWRQLDAFKKRKHILLEIKLPEEIKKPMKAMEDVFTSLYMVALEHAPGPLREKWIEGKTVKHVTFSLEIVGDGGTVHFYIWIDDYLKHTVESIFYAQYPDIEIREAEDYTKKVPQDIPNKDWNIVGMDWALVKNSAIPLKTHQDFEIGTESKEEKRVDPLARLLEAFSQLKKGEQVWLQFTLTDAGKDWVKKGEELRDEIAKRKKNSAKPKPILLEALEIIIFGAKDKQEKKEEKLFFPEMQMTPGERKGVESMERKMSKQGFKVGIRTVYISRRDVFFGPHMGLPITFLCSLGKGSQYLVPIAKTRTKVKSLVKLWDFDKKRLILRQRKMFRNYQWRVFPFFPEEGGTSVLNPEELAVLFHFPGREVAPATSLQRIKARRGEAPQDLPVE